MPNVDATAPTSVVVDVNGAVSAVGNGNARGKGIPHDTHAPPNETASDGTRLWTTLNHPSSVSTRSSAFAFSSNGLPRKYDYRDWSSTTFIFRDRAVSNFIWPWGLCVAVSLVWCVLYKSVEDLQHARYDLSEFGSMYALIFTALGFMLVFRLSRAAIRFWDCRTAWGTIAMRGRMLVDDVIVNLGPTAPKQVDDIIRWFCAFAVATKCHLRIEQLPSQQLSGILTAKEVDNMLQLMTTRFHLFCANKIRSAIASALLIETEADPKPFSNSLHPQHAATLMHSMRHHLDVLVDQAGSMERIKATRLPIVYVAHLRTFLLVYILSMPFVYVSLWGWGVVPATAVIAFALLGIEGAATECENPFSAKRTNHLGMDGFCENIIDDVSVMLEWWRHEVETGKGWGGRRSISINR